MDDHQVNKMMMIMSCSKDHPIFPTWKLYDNPFYNHPHNPQFHPTNHNLHLPISTRKIAASFWDLTFIRPIMESELDLAQARITELQAELKCEKKARKRGETMNKRLAKELAEERRGREAVERVCEELARGISFDKAEIDRLKREIGEERKMLRVAEVFREERVQMKLAEARFFLEEKLLEIEGMHEKVNESQVKGSEIQVKACKSQVKVSESQMKACESQVKVGEVQVKACESQVKACEIAYADLSGKFSRLMVGEKSSCLTSNDNFGCVSINRRCSPEGENHHIKRGIKGFVEFPRVVRPVGSKNRHWGNKLECQKAQLRILLRQKSPIRSSTFIIS
ncbi:branchless trichome [Euphorbia peplus]|nr:branchless trichome [Euphorbia peplus]